MVPRSITQNLAALRRRERLLTFLWGASCWLAIALVLLLLCMFADWLIDRWRDTPIAIRLVFLIVQVIVWVVAGFFFIVWPQIRWLPDEKLALWVEDKLRKFDHRLISAVQLNDPDARLDGMSEELIKMMTREAEKEANQFSFATIADHSRFGFSTALAGTAFLLFILPMAAFHHVSFVLLARQALLDYEIPRSVHLESASVVYWPAGDDIPIRYRVKGEFNPDMVGSIYLSPGGRFDLVFIQEDADGAIFGADIEASKLPLTDTLRYSARLADGRTKAPSDMQLVPRPVITENRAWVILPAFCDTRPVKEKVRYERQQASGNVIAIPGSSVRVQFETQRPITKAWLELRGIDKIELKSEDGKPPPITFVDKGKMDMRVVHESRFLKGDEKTDVWIAETTFDLKDGIHRYVMKCEDEHGFANVPKPAQSIDIVPEGAPLVSLLKDTFDLGDGSSFDLEGLPVVIGRPIRIPYSCEGAYGLSRARLLYRVLKKHESGNEPMEDEEWTKLELPEFTPKEGHGDFDRKRGVFENMSFQNQVPFFLIPSPDPEKFMGRTIGGGRYHLQTKEGALIDSKGKAHKLKSGDQIEYCVEIFAAEREPKASIPVTRSESRVATIMEEKEFFAWLGQVRQEDERIRQLEKLQKGIFDRN